MGRWREEQLQALLTIRSEHQLIEAITAIARTLEFDYCAYGLRWPVPLMQPKMEIVSNYPDAWQKRYCEKGYLSVDPIVSHGMRSPLPIVWSNEMFPSAQEVCEEARAIGLRVGWAQSSRDASGMVGLLSLARIGEVLSRSELRAKSLQLAWLAHVAHMGMSRYLMTNPLPQEEARLTERELVVLRWTADGKTSSEISEIVGISVSTVNFHIRNAIAKLGTTNKLAAAVKAATLGMLY